MSQAEKPVASRSLPIETDRRSGIADFVIPAILAVLPSLFGLLTFEHDYARSRFRDLAVPVVALEVAILVAAWIGGMRLRPVVRAIPAVPKAAAIVLLSAALLAAMLYAPGPTTAVRRTGLTALHLLVAVAIWNHCLIHGRAAALRIVLAVGTGIAVFAILAWIALFSVRGDPAFEWVQVGFGVSHVRHFSYVGVLAAGIGAGLVARPSTRRAAVCGFAIMAAGWFLCVWCGSRAGTIGCATGAVVALVLARRGSRLSATGWVLAAAVAGIALSLIWIPPSDMWGLQRIFGVVAAGTGTSDGALNGRSLLWSEAWRLFVQSPAIGYGEGQFRALSNAPWTANHPHDLPLQLLVQWGLVGTLAATVMAGYAALPGVMRLGNADDASLGAFAALAGVLTLSLVDGPLFYVMPTMLVLVLAAVFASGVPAEPRRLP